VLEERLVGALKKSSSVNKASESNFLLNPSALFNRFAGGGAVFVKSVVDAPFNFIVVGKFLYCGQTLSTMNL
jgi:hypothetical protein